MRSRTRDVAVLGLMTAIIELAKHALDTLPNIELVSFLILVFTLHFGLKTLAAVYAFVLIECFYWGLGLWSISYLFVWPVLVAGAWLAGKIFPVKGIRKGGIGQSLLQTLPYAAVSGVFGLLFGAICSLTTMVISGPAAAFGWWLAGVPFDLLHGISNFLICMLLFMPVHRALAKLL